LRISQIKVALDEAGVPHPSRFWLRSHRSGPVLVLIWAPKPNLRGPFWSAGDESVVVYLGLVPSAEGARAERGLLETAVPDLVAWLRTATTAPEGWRLLAHELRWEWINNTVVLTKDD
jgi:hypothetical protein